MTTMSPEIEAGSARSMSSSLRRTSKISVRGFGRPAGPRGMTVTDDTQGPLATMEALASYGERVDFGRVAAQANLLPQFLTDMTSRHPLHPRRSRHETHSADRESRLAGSIIEQLKIIPGWRIRRPTAAALRTRSIVVVPSMPGTASRASRRSRLGPERIGRAWDVLMKRLATAGTCAGRRLGAFVVDQMGLQAPEGSWRSLEHAGHGAPTISMTPSVAAIPFPPGSHPRSTEPAKVWCGRQASRIRTVMARVRRLCMGSRTLRGPRGLAHRPQRTPTATAAAVAAALERTASASGELTRDEVLDNITMYWLTNTGVSASRLFGVSGGFFNARASSSRSPSRSFPGSRYQAPRSGGAGLPESHLYNQVIVAALRRLGATQLFRRVRVRSAGSSAG
jgi:hypothetical protein